MVRFFYSILFYLLIPFLLLRLWRRAKKASAYGERIPERFGFFNPPASTHKKVVWFHTVSVGEFIGAQPLIRWLLQRDDLEVVVTTMTPTGSAQVKASFGDRVFHVYAPYDTPTAVARFLRKVKPSLFITMETELWPNTIAACKARNIPCLLINARLSQKSLRGYQKFSALTRPMVQSLSRVAVQNQDDAARFEVMGLNSEQYQVTGNIKFDLTLTDEVRERASAFRQMINPDNRRKILIAASTHAGEDEIILSAFTCVKKRLPEAVLILVPRHPERFDAVFERCKETEMVVIRRSHHQDVSACDILLGDTMGELLMFYGASNVAFVGGSLVANGGHNFIEAAVWGLPLLSGPHLFNFAEVSRLLQQADALTLVEDADSLAQAVEDLLSDLNVAKAMGARALGVAQSNRGALLKTQSMIEAYLA